MNININNNLNARKIIAKELADQYINQTSPSVIFIQAGYGQGKSYIIDCLLDNLKKCEKIKIYRNIDNEFIPGSQNIISSINSLNVLGGPLYKAMSLKNRFSKIMFLQSSCAYLYSV